MIASRRGGIDDLPVKLESNIQYANKRNLRQTLLPAAHLHALSARHI
jgi:hypothetical protein